MKNKRTSRLLSMLLCLALVLGMVPAAGAAEAAATCSHGDHTGWNKVASNGFIPARGNVKLEGNLKLTEPVEVTGGTLHICLNGHTITGTGESLFVVSGKGTLNICDCKGGGIVGGTTLGDVSLKNGFVTITDLGTFNLYGGTLSGNKGPSSWGGAVQVDTKGTFNMYGGTITNNSTKHYGGAISLVGNGTFVMNGGTISNNINENMNGGAIVLDEGTSTVTINGGTITGNTAPNGGAIGTRGAGGTLVINGGTISNNVATGEYGGAVYGALTMTMTGGTFTGNKGKAGGAIYLGKGSLTMTGGSVVDNICTTPSHFGAIHITADGGVKLDISGDPVVQENGFTGKATAVIHDLKEGAKIHSKFAIDVKKGDKTVETDDLTLAGTIIYAAKPAASNGITMAPELVDGATYDADMNLLTVSEGTETTKLNVTLPAGVNAADLTWESSNPDAATVKDGVITHNGWGNTTITARAKDTEYYATIDVTMQNNALKVLTIGNHLSRGSMYYLPQLGSALGMQIMAAYLEQDLGTLRDHAHSLAKDATDYTYYVTDSKTGKFGEGTKQRISSVLKSQPWDYVIIQHSDTYCGYYGTYNSDLEYIIDAVRDMTDAKVYWNMNWAAQRGYAGADIDVNHGMHGKITPGNFQSDYEGEPLYMYNAIITCLGDYIVGADSRFGAELDGYIPTGAVIQDLRGAFGDVLTHDGIELSLEAGRLAASMAMLKTLTGADLGKISAEALNGILEEKDAGEGVSAVDPYVNNADNLAKVVSAVNSACADAAAGKLPQKVDAPALKTNTDPATFTIAQLDPPNRARFPGLAVLGDGSLVLAYNTQPSHLITTGEGKLQEGGEYIVKVVAGDKTGRNWNLDEPLLVLDNKQIEEWGIFKTSDRYNDPGINYIFGGAGDSNLNTFQLDMDGDGTKEEVLFYSFWLRFFTEDGSYTYTGCITYSLDGGKTWAKAQQIYSANPGSAVMIYGDTICFDDGQLLVPCYFGLKDGLVHPFGLLVEWDAAKQKWIVLETNEVTNTVPDITKSINEVSFVSPDGGDVVYALTRHAGTILRSEDRGRTWTQIGWEPETEQPGFILLDNETVLATYTNSDRPRNTYAKLFYLRGDWSDSPGVIVYDVPHEAGTDAGDPAGVRLQDGKILVVSYDTGFAAMQGVIFDPYETRFLPYEVTGTDRTIMFEKDFADNSTEATFDKEINGSYTAAADFTLNNASSTVTVKTDVGDVVVKANSVTFGDKTQTLTLKTGEPAHVRVSVVGVTAHVKVWQGTEPEKLTLMAHGEKNGAKAGVSATGAVLDSFTVSKVFNKIELEGEVTAAEKSGTKQLTYEIVPAQAAQDVVWTSSDPSVVSVDQNGVITYNAPGIATITMDVLGAKRTCTVNVIKAAAELSGIGETKTYLSEDFESYTVGEDSYYDLFTAGKSSMYIGRKEGTTRYDIEEENGNKYLRIPNSGWIRTLDKITGDYTVTFDYRLTTTYYVNGMYTTLWQDTDISAFTNIRTTYTQISYRAKKTTEDPDTTTNPSILVDDTDASMLGFNVWTSVKITRVNGGLYMKLWCKGTPEPDNWTVMSLHDVYDTSVPSHFRLSTNNVAGNGQPAGFYDVDNIKITQQLVSGVDAMQDVYETAWFYDSVKYAVENKIMSGYNANTFGPNDTLNRAMVVQVLYNKEGQPALNGMKNNFSDVPATQWYNNAITWGANKGVVSGYGGNVFKPDQAVSIEQVAVILHNYSGKPAGNGDLSKVPGCSDWAAPALKWALEKGILDGMPFEKITDNATRAQTAYMLMKYLKK